MLTAAQVIAALDLKPHPIEGGYFRETYRSSDRLSADALPPHYGAARAASTAIYYLLTPDTFSAIHRLATDEVFHFYLGDPVEMLLLHPDGRGEIVTLGPDLGAGQRPQVVVPRGVWQGSSLAPGGAFALLGCTVAPGFDYTDYETGRRDSLTARYPAFADLLRRLTRDP
jgi:predicted cupin superfamily sugar epimerase